MIQLATLRNGITDERQAQAYYKDLIPRTVDGNERASFKHMLKEEKDHEELLVKMLTKRIEEQKIYPFKI